jgi:thermitase
MPTPLRRAHTAAAVLLVFVGVLCVPAIAAAAAEPRLIVGFAPEATDASRSSALGRAGVRAKSGIPVLDAVVVRVAPGTLAATRRKLLARPDVEYVEIDHVARAYGDLDAARSGLAASWLPNDTFFSQQWALGKLGADRAWEHARGAGVTIAVLDTGVDYIHPDLAGRVDLGRDFVGGDDDPMDEQGHGTHVAGIAAASADDGFGVAGIAPGARILAVRVLDADGAGNYSQVAGGIVHAVERGAKVINLSLGGPEDSELLHSAIDFAAARGVIVTCASGNESAKAMGYPAQYDSCVSVGATDSADEIGHFSNRGTGLDLVAPGVQVLSSTSGGSHDSWDGTSMASPYVGGVGALLVSQGLSRREAIDAMTSTARDLGAPGVDTTYGVGRVDAGAAVEAASRMPRRAADATAPVVTGITQLPVRRTTTRSSKVEWKLRSSVPFRRVGTSRFAGSYSYVKRSTRGNVRTTHTFRFSRGIVYRRTVVHVRTRVVKRTTTSMLPIRVDATDDQGVDRVAVTVDGRVRGVDWSAGDGWVVLVPCDGPPSSVVVGSAWDAADNEGASTVRTRIAC